MKDAKPLGKYVSRILGSNLQDCQKEYFENLPMYLISRYNYYSANLLNQKIIFMLCNDDELTPAQIFKDCSKVRETLNAFVVYVDDAMTSYNRSRLINYGVQFIVPEKQLFLPELKIDLREQFSGKKNQLKFFTPSAQMVVLSAILNTFSNKFSIGSLNDRFGISTSNAQRIIDDLEDLELVASHKEGRDRIAQFSYQGKELWDMSLKYMKSPVKKTVYVKDFNSAVVAGFISGLTALSEYSMLVAPRLSVIAASDKTWKEYASLYQLAEYPDEAALQVDIWSYPPEKVLNYISESGDTVSFGHAKVDKLSLYLSLMNDYDERVQGELEEMLEGMQW